MWETGKNIERGDFPRWTMFIRVMPEKEAASCPYHPFDLTKVWLYKDCPLIEVGVLELNRHPENYFAQVEQSAFNPANIVPGIGFSPDQMRQGRRRRSGRFAQRVAAGRLAFWTAGCAHPGSDVQNSIFAE